MIGNGLVFLGNGNQLMPLTKRIRFSSGQRHGLFDGERLISESPGEGWPGGQARR
jgi:hypothetical protein